MKYLVVIIFASSLIACSGVQRGEAHSNGRVDQCSETLKGDQNGKATTGGEVVQDRSRHCNN